MRNHVWPFSCVAPAGASNELDVQNEWEENTHTLSVDPLSPSRLLSVQHVMCKDLEFRVRFEAFYGNYHGKRKHIHH